MTPHNLPQIIRLAGVSVSGIPGTLLVLRELAGEGRPGEERAGYLADIEADIAVIERRVRQGAFACLDGERIGALLDNLALAGKAARWLADPAHDFGRALQTEREAEYREVCERLEEHGRYLQSRALVLAPIGFLARKC
jgi:hypothetical protein